jgi:hypothetical protein
MLGNDARENKERAGDRKTPSDKVPSAPEEYAHSDQHRQKLDAERFGAAEVQ